MEQIELGKVLDNPYQPRTVDNAEHIESLALSIAADGLLQVPTARRMEDGSYQLAFGHSRRKAFEFLNACYAERDLTDRYQGYWMMPINVEILTDEEMYRYAVAENVQRKDLGVIEVAKAMVVYRDQFGRNSKEIGALFGMNDATVRGILYMLGLPQSWQDALSNGSISQGDARLGLSLQKLVSAEVMEETIRKIIEEHGNETPKSIMDEVIDDAANIKSMWRDDRDGKPRGDWRNSWLLDMKNFPNKMLPELTVEDLVEVFELDDSTNNKRVWNCIHQAKDYNELMLAWKSSDFEDDHPRAEKLSHLLNPPSCVACPFYAKVDGHHYCGMDACHKRKTHAWHAEILRAGSKDLGIPVYEETDGKYLVLSYDTKSTALFEKRSKDLRLMPKEKINGYASQNLKGVNDDVYLVVITGEAAVKLQGQSQKNEGMKLKGNAVDLVQRRKTKLFNQKRKELIWEFCLVTKSMFEGLPVNVLEELNDWKYLGVDDRPLKDEDGDDVKTKGTDKADHQKHMLVWRLVYEMMDYSARADQTKAMQVSKFLEGLAKKWNVKYPKSLTKMAEEADQEIASVSVETKKH